MELLVQYDVHNHSHGSQNRVRFRNVSFFLPEGRTFLDLVWEFVTNPSLRLLSFSSQMGRRFSMLCL